MGSIILNGESYGGGSGGNALEITKTAYDNLSLAEKRNGTIYFTVPNKYTYTSFMNDAIIVRQNVNVATDKKMFFVGLEKTSSDISITDTDLLAFLSDVTNGYKKATYSYSDSNNTRNGNIGFYNTGSGVKLRSWSQNWQSLISGTFYGVIDLNESPVSATSNDGQTNPYVDPYAVSGEYAVYYMNNKYSSIIIQNITVPLVPAMTGYTTPSGEVIDSFNHAGSWATWKLFDGSYSTFGGNSTSDVSGTGTRDAYIGYHFPNPVRVDKFKFAWGNQNNNNYKFTLKLQGSNDGSTWTDLTDEVTAQMSVDGLEFPTTKNNTVSYEYVIVRWVGYSVATGIGYPQAYEVQFYGEEV